MFFQKKTLLIYEIYLRNIPEYYKNLLGVCLFVCVTITSNIFRKFGTHIGEYYRLSYTSIDFKLKG